MAEKVVIKGGDLDGSVLENAASEVTLLRLVAAMEKMAAAQGKGGSASGAAKKTQDLYEQSLKSNTDQTKKSTKELKENEKKLKENNKQLDTATEKLGQFGAGLEKWSNRLAKGLEMAFATTTPTIQGFANAFSGVPIVGGLISTLGGILGQQVDTFRNLSASGIQLGDSLYSASSAAARAGMPLDTFTSVLKNNSASLAQFAGGAAEGARRFSEISAKMKKEGFGDKMMRLGYTMEELGEYTAGYIELQTKLGKSQKMTDAELASGTQEYLLQLDMLSRVTGMSRKEAEAALKAQMNDKRLQVLMAGMSDKARMALQGTVATIEKSSPEMAEGLKELVATNGIPISDFGKSLARNNPELVENAKLLRAGKIGQEEFLASVRKAAAQSSELTEEEEKLHAMLVAQGKASPFADRVALMALKNLGEKATGAAKAQEEAMNNQKLAAAGMDQALTKLRAAFVDAFIKTGLLDKVAAGFSLVIEKLGKFVADFMDFDLSTALANLFDPAGATQKDVKGNEIRVPRSVFDAIGSAMSAGITSLFENPKTYLYLAGAIGALFAASVVKQAVVGSFANLTAKAAEKLTIGKAADAATSTVAGKAGGAAESGIGKTLSGIGKGTGAILEGLAQGIKAFANPQILVGATILSGSIAIIGAGIAGAAWLLGKAMPTLAEGFAAFSAIDGKKLTDAGIGIGALGAGLAVFGAGGVAAGIGGIIGNLTDGINEFFGGKTPFDKLIEFSKLNIDGERVKVNAEAFAAFAKGLALMGAAGTIGGVGAIVEGIGKFFGGKPPFEKFVEFSKLNVDGAKVKVNAAAFVSFANAMSAFKASNSIGVGIGAIVEGVGKFFGGRPPLEKFVAFSKLSVDGRAVESNAKAFVAFSTAMASYKAGSSISAGIATIVDGVASFFNGKNPIQKFVEFSKLDIDPDKVSRSAKAFVDYSNAMSKFSGSDSIVAGIGTIVDGVAAFFNGKNPIDKFVEFSKVNIDADKVSKNAKAFADFGMAMNAFSGSNNIATGIGSMIDGIATFFGAKTPIDKLKDFSKVEIDTERAIKNAKAFSEFGNAMKTVSGITITAPDIDKNFSERLIQISNIKVDTSKLDGVTSSISGFNKAMNNIDFKKLDINKSIDVEKTISSLQKLSDAMTTLKKSIGDSAFLDKLQNTNFQAKPVEVPKAQPKDDAQRQSDDPIGDVIRQKQQQSDNPIGDVSRQKQQQSADPISDIIRQKQNERRQSLAIPDISSKRSEEFRAKLAASKAEMDSISASAPTEELKASIEKLKGSFGELSTMGEAMPPSNEQVVLLSELGKLLGQLNSNIQSLVSINQEIYGVNRKTLQATRANSNSII